jgi:hypothetical protein
MAPVTELMLGCQTFVKNFTWQKMVIIDGKNGREYFEYCPRKSFQRFLKTVMKVVFYLKRILK